MTAYYCETVNNLTFAQTQSGDVDEAIEEFVRLGRHPEAKAHVTQYLANAGALAYALGQIEEGRDLYRRAIQSARRRSEPQLEALAYSFFARVSMQSGDPQSPAILQEAVERVPRLPSEGAIFVVQELVDGSKREQLRSAALGRVAHRKWRWDAVSNTVTLVDV
jgi:tetratricopeptide (TPR) repeat protein